MFRRFRKARVIAASVIFRSGWRLGKNLPQSADQRFRIGTKTVVPDTDRLASRQRLQRLWKLIRIGHLRVADQNRNHPLLLIQGCLDLEPNEIPRMFQSSLHRGIDGVDPANSNHREKYRALRHAFVQDLNEIGARLDVYVKKYPTWTECFRQPVKQPPGRRRIVVPTITDEYSASHTDEASSPFCPANPSERIDFITEGTRPKAVPARLCWPAALLAPRREGLVEGAFARRALFDCDDGATLVVEDQRNVEPGTFLQELRIALTLAVDTVQTDEE